MDESRNINQFGDFSSYVEKNLGTININVKPSNLSEEEIAASLFSASVDLKDYPNKFGNKKHIDRRETNLLLNWILTDLQKDKSPVAILAGNAGFGKSVILRDLYHELIKNNIPVLGIKADRLIIQSISELNTELNLGDGIESIFKKLSERHSRIVLLVDQIDALSQSLSSDRNPLNSYHRLIGRLSGLLNIRIIISCRLYDLDYDPLLQEYKNKQIFSTSLFSISQVEEVLTDMGIDTKNVSLPLKDFLRTPLHLQVFCKISQPETFVGTITLQNLYDTLWEEYVLTKPSQNKLSAKKVRKFIEELTDKMYSEQQIVADIRHFIGKYKKELDYLNTNEIITKNKNNKIQFVHQSFFDYSFARIFVEKDHRLSKKLTHQHQGLFIRSKVSQVLDYLRELDPKQYIDEIGTILFKNYRFHIKLLIINKLGFREKPLIEEKVFIKTKLINNPEYLRLFLESVNSSEWFTFLINEIGLLHYFKENDDVYINTIYGLCRKILVKEPACIVEFLKTIPKTYQKKDFFIGRALFSINEDNVNVAFELFSQSKKQWDEFSYYHFLEKATKNNPDFVISELHQVLLSFSNKEESHLSTVHIPGSHDSSRIYKSLFEKHPATAVNYFIKAVQLIVERSKIIYKAKYQDRLIGDWAFYHYVPFKEQNYDLHYDILDFSLEYLTKLASINIDEVKNYIVPLLDSQFTSILNLPLYLFIRYPKEFINEIYQLLIRPELLKNFSIHNSLFVYQIRELLKVSYEYFSDIQKNTINDLVLNAIPEHEKTINDAYKPKGITPYGYTHSGRNQFELISMIPEKERKKNTIINKKYNELSRKFPVLTNSQPEGIVVRSGEIILSEQAYQKMTFEQWKNSFRKFVDNGHIRWEGVSELGHNRKFEEVVSQNPAYYSKLVEQIIKDDSIPHSYAVYGLQGLQKGNFNPTELRQLYFDFIGLHKVDIESEYLLYLIWLIDYFIKTDIINDEIINFLVYVINNYPDSEIKNNDPMFDGINSIRGAAVDKLVKCYNYKPLKELVFTTLENIANNSAVHTRACALMHLALLINIDKERTIKLFLELNHDFHPKLVSIPLHNLNLLRYLFSTEDDFKKIVNFLTKSINIEEAHEVVTNVLFWAWLNDYEGSENLLDSVLSKSIKSKKKAVEVAFGHLPNSKYFTKCIKILESFLKIDDKDLGYAYEHQFIHLKNDLFDSIYDFLIKYSKSEAGKYRDHFFYEYLLKAAKDRPKECIDLAINFKTHLKPDIQERGINNEPLQVVIQAYNAIRKYDIESEYIEKSMNVFDEMLIIPEYRGIALDVLNKLDN